MRQGDVETYFQGSQWHCRVEGQSDPFQSFDTKKRAVEAGRYVAQALEVGHIIRCKNGRISQRSTRDRSTPRLRLATR